MRYSIEPRERTYVKGYMDFYLLLKEWVHMQLNFLTI